MSLKMAPNATCQSVSYLCAYQVCLGDVSQCCRQRGGVAICREKLGVANHSSCLTLSQSLRQCRESLVALPGLSTVLQGQTHVLLPILLLLAQPAGVQGLTPGAAVLLNASLWLH